MKYFRWRRSRDRSGFILVIVMVCLAVASALALVSARQIVMERGVLRSEQWRLQASWLAESAVERAASQLASSAGYVGEIWKIPAAELDGQEDAEVHISVEPVGQGGLYRVHVEADCPRRVESRCRHIKDLVVDRKMIVKN